MLIPITSKARRHRRLYVSPRNVVVHPAAVVSIGDQPGLIDPTTTTLICQHPMTHRGRDRVASLFTRCGLQPGDRLAMAISNYFEFVEVMFGAMHEGVVSVPLNIKLGPDTLDYVVRDAGCASVVVEQASNANVMGRHGHLMPSFAVAALIYPQPSYEPKKAYTIDYSGLMLARAITSFQFSDSSR